MKTGSDQSKHLFHVVWSVPAKVFLTVMFSIWSILTDHDLFGSRWARLMEHGFCSGIFTLIKRAQVTQRASLGTPVVPIVFFPKKRNDYPLNSIWNARNAPTRLNSNEIWLLISVRRSKCCVRFLILEGDQTFLAHRFIHEQFSKL